MYTNNVCFDEEIRTAFVRIITKYSSFYVVWKAHHVVWSGFLMPADKSEDTVTACAWQMHRLGWYTGPPTFAYNVRDADTLGRLNVIAYKGELLWLPVCIPAYQGPLKTIYSIR